MRTYRSLAGPDVTGGAPDGAAAGAGDRAEAQPTADAITRNAATFFITDLLVTRTIAAGVCPIPSIAGGRRTDMGYRRLGQPAAAVSTEAWMPGTETLHRGRLCTQTQFQRRCRRPCHVLVH